MIVDTIFNNILVYYSNQFYLW